MEVLLVSVELSPYVVATAAGEAVAQLAKALTQLGHGVTIAMPRAPAFDAAGLMMARRLTPLGLSNGDSVTVYDGQLPSGARLVLFEGAKLPARDSILDEADSERWSWLGTLCQAVAAFAEQRASQGTPFNVIHAHGWPTAAVTALSSLPSLLTFYDSEQLGVLPASELAHFGLAEARKAAFAYGSEASLLKGGMLSAGGVTTISAHLGEHALRVDFAGALAAALNDAGIEIKGVGAGLDYAVCNPATDTALPSRYDAESSRIKGNCKTAVCREFELEVDPDVPLMVFSQTIESKAGADLLASAASALCKSPLQLVVAGTGTTAETKPFKGARLAKRANFRFVERSAFELTRRLLSAADIALCPQREPGLGTALRLAQRYGAVPVALATPVALDVVVDCPSDLGTGTGFLFDEASGDALQAAAERAVAAYHHTAFGDLRRRIMRLDHGWERSARRYAQLYKSLTQPSIL